LVGTVFKIGLLNLIFTAYVLLLYLLRREFNTETKISKFILMMVGLFLVTTVNTLLFITYTGVIPPEAMSIIILGIREYFIQISFAIAIFLYLRLKPLKYILDILFIGIAANVLMAIVELVKDPTHRISMLFPEPSAAGYYYLFIFFIVLHNYRDKGKYYVSRFFLIIGLAIGSKAQYILLIFVGILKYSSLRGMIMFLLVTSALVYGFKDKVLAMPEVVYNKYVLDTYLDGGLKNFKEENRIWGTYVTRVSGIEGAVRCLYDNPFGIGTGYGLWFSINMPKTGIDNPETNRVIAEYSATARSNLLDLFLRTGIFGLLVYLYIGSWFYKIRKKHYYLYQSFIMLTLASLFIELNPMFAYLAILISILEKVKQDKKKDLTNEEA